MRLRNFALPSWVWLAFSGAAIAMSACQTAPYCLNCVDGGSPRPDTATVRDVAPVDVVDEDSAAVDVRPDLIIPDGCRVGDPEICNGVDDNCDGRIDEGFDLQTDPRNCGACGNACIRAHARTDCMAGRCTIPTGGCDFGFYDLDGNPDNGCEYACVPVPGATDDRTCDNRDDNCNGRRDEDVDLCGDIANCGRCSRNCILVHATARCERVPGSMGACTESNTRCAVAMCGTGFYDIDGDPANGCEYECTPSGAEVCDGADNDCNGAVDDGDPGGGAACGSSMGVCRPGVNHCRMGRVVCEGGVTPTPEMCDGMDNDCNGTTDDGTLADDLRIGASCGLGLGDCRQGSNRCMAGAVVCTGAVGPTPELCDGRDNNCDGMIDNGVPAGGTCGSMVGECTPGTLNCIGGSMRCTGGRAGTTEVCDGLDNDCDGTRDNGFDLQRDINNCGSCGNSCAGRPHAITNCTLGACVQIACETGFFDLDRNPVNGCEYACSFSGPTEICNGVDDNCNGMIDEGVVPPASFCRSAGECAGATATCAGSRGFVCSYGATVELDAMTGQPVAVETRCNGRDDNCNGAIDESFVNLGRSCSNGGVGACGAPGVFACNMAGTTTVCNAPPVGSAGPERCNGLDDDCDGSVDEPRGAPGTNPSFVNTAWVLVAPSTWMMQYEASRPDATAATQGIISTRACSTSGVLPWTNLNVTQATNACTAAGGRLCVEAEWQAACRSTAGTCTWSYAGGVPTCNTYSTSTCNGVDFDIDGATPGIQNGLLPTGNRGSCTALTSGGTVFDMSGNAREFSAPRAANVNPLRGGSYNNIAFGTTCTFNWSVVDNTFAFVNTGFRCCATGAVSP